MVYELCRGQEGQGRQIHRGRGTIWECGQRPAVLRLATSESISSGSCTHVVIPTVRHVKTEIGVCNAKVLRGSACPLTLLRPRVCR